MDSDETGPFNIGSEEMVSINTLVEIVSSIAKKNITIKHVDGPLGVRGRIFNNRLIKEKLDWDYSMSFQKVLKKRKVDIKAYIILIKTLVILNGSPRGV